jgi:hypothetical protein
MIEDGFKGRVTRESSRPGSLLEGDVVGLLLGSLRRQSEGKNLRWLQQRTSGSECIMGTINTKPNVLNVHWSATHLPGISGGPSLPPF